MQDGAAGALRFMCVGVTSTSTPRFMCVSVTSISMPLIMFHACQCDLDLYASLYVCQCDLTSVHHISLLLWNSWLSPSVGMV